MLHTQDRGTHATLVDRYQVLLDLGRPLGGESGLSALYRAIYEEATVATEVSGFYLATYDEETDLAEMVFTVDRGEEGPTGFSYRGSESDVLRTGEPTLVRDRRAGSYVVVGETEEAEEDTTRSAVCVPMRRDGRIVGEMSVQSYRPGAYGTGDVRLLQVLADIAAVALENARLVLDLESRRREAERVEEIGRVLTSSLDTSEVLEKVVRSVLDVLSVERCVVWFMEGREARVVWTGGDVELPVGAQWALPDDAAQQLLARREPLLVEELDESPLVPPEYRSRAMSGTAAAVPVVVDDEVVGALSAARRPGSPFDDDDIRVLERIARQAAVALGNARLHASLEALSLTDPLTGLPNRRHLQIHLRREVAAARRGRPLAVVIFDLDNFKRTNDLHGHAAGDEALRTFGRILDDENRKMNLVARYGGDEFIAVLSGADEGGAEGYVRRVKKRVADDATLSSFGIQVSSGVAAFDPSTMREMDDIVRAADDEMYREKGSRRR